MSATLAQSGIAQKLERTALPKLLQAVGILMARLGLGVFLLITSVYCLLLYIPFTYYGFIHYPLLAWLPVFVRIHSYLYCGLAAAVAITLLPDLAQHKTRRSAAAFIGLHITVGIYLLFRPALTTMLRDFFAYVWSMLVLFPLIWLGCQDLAAQGVQAGRRIVSWTAPVFAATAVALGFAATSRSGSFLEVGASLVSHLVLFMGVGTVLWLIAHARPDKLRFALTRAFAWLLGAVVIRYLVLPTISFEGLQANVFAAVMALAFVLYTDGTVSRVRALRPENHAIPHLWLMGVAGAFLLLAAYEIPRQLGPTDWDFVLQKLAVVLVWVLALALVSWQGAWLGKRPARVAALGILLMAAGGWAGSRVLASGGQQLSARLDAYAGSDISFKTARDLLARSVDNEKYSGFYQFLRQNTNLGSNVRVGAADVRLVRELKPAPGSKPNIFFFVIDSLRRDYVSAYNPAVTFTPEIDRFARDSVVMQNAFSHYAGTALSEPALWVGAMQLHKQYIQPFYPMNSLQKLLEVDGYQSYISVDPILQIILRPSDNIVKLDEKAPLWSDLDFIPTLKELEQKIDERRDPSRPIFAYTQPQNVHTLNLERSRKHHTRREISMDELQRMDAAFGEFLGFLKARGLYDNSIIILTSDHGDSYGEFGRYGHSDFLFPEIIRIPLIIHLPDSMRNQFVWDTKHVAFSLDITPSLYYLLGHRPIENNELYGRPLFTRTREELESYQRADYLLVSSYAPVYGILANSGQSLFIVDAVNHKNYFYDLADDPAGIHNRVTPQIRDTYESLIRQEISRIDSFYHYSGAGSQ